MAAEAEYEAGTEKYGYVGGHHINAKSAFNVDVNYMLIRNFPLAEIINLLNLNYYTYCENNPVVYDDPTGYHIATDKDDNNLNQDGVVEFNQSDSLEQMSKVGKVNYAKKPYKAPSVKEIINEDDNSNKVVRKKDVKALEEDYFTDWNQEGATYGFESSGASFINSITQSQYNSIYKPESIIPEIKVEHKMPLTKSSKDKFMTGTISGNALFQGSMIYAGDGFDEFLSRPDEYVLGLDKVAEIEKVDGYIDLSGYDEVEAEAGGKTYNVNGKILSEKEFAALRQKTVNKAWRQEKELITKTGRGTKDWTPEEIQELMSNGKVKGYECHHMKSAEAYPDFAGDSNNIQFLKGRNMSVNEHLDAHGGSYRNPTNGYYDPNSGNFIEFGDSVPWK